MPRLRLSNRQKEAMYRDGYVILKKAVPEDMVTAAPAQALPRRRTRELQAERRVHGRWPHVAQTDSHETRPR